jgi:Flp pilus assembly pilin Flp
MSKFLSYLRNDKGGAVEYILVVAGIGGAVAVATSSTTVKTAVNGMFNNVFNGAAKKATF